MADGVADQINGTKKSVFKTTVIRDLLRAVGPGAAAKWAGRGSTAEDSAIKGTLWR